MFLLDDCLFKHWRAGLVDKEECLLRAQHPSELAAKFSAAEHGEGDDEDTDDEEFEEDDEEEEEDED